jgi:hypothetical protein
MLVKADGLDDAIFGVTEVTRDGQPYDVMVYDTEAIVRILVHRDKMSYEDAVDWMEFNIVCAFVGPHTPLFVRPFDPDAYDDTGEIED